MKFTRSKLADIVIIEPTIHEDERGYFTETFRNDQLEKFIGYEVKFVQENQSKSKMGVIRGLHYQLPPAQQCKLVSVTKGKIFDVAVDIRKKSPDFGKYVSCVLSEENKNQIYIPSGFAHGFMALEEDSIICYKVNNYYSALYERGITFDDPTIDIVWTMQNHKPQLSDKDKKLPLLKNADLFTD